MQKIPRPFAVAIGVAMLSVAGVAVAVAAGVAPDDGPSKAVLLQNDAFALEMVGVMSLRLTVAALVGVILALHPSRRRRQGTSRRRRRMPQAQIVLTVAAALMIIVLNDSFERALGLVALGSFIRFRNVVSDPVETAMIFLHIGLGMACGLGQFGIAGTGTVFVSLLLVPVLRMDRRRDTDEEEGVPLIAVELRGDDAGALAELLRSGVQPGSLRGITVSESKGRLRAEIAMETGADPDAFVRDLVADAPCPITHVRWRLIGDDG